MASPACPQSPPKAAPRRAGPSSSRQRHRKPSRGHVWAPGGPTAGPTPVLRPPSAEICRVTSAVTAASPLVHHWGRPAARGGPPLPAAACGPARRPSPRRGRVAHRAGHCRPDTAPSFKLTWSRCPSAMVAAVLGFWVPSGRREAAAKADTSGGGRARPARASVRLCNRPHGPQMIGPAACSRPRGLCEHEHRGSGAWRLGRAPVLPYPPWAGAVEGRCDALQRGTPFGHVGEA